MRIGSDVVAGIHYVIWSEDGTLIDRTPRGKPWYYLHGSRECPQGLERALKSRKVGDSVQILLGPSETYGERHEDAVLKFDREVLPFEQEPRVGMILSIVDKRGETELRVVDVTEREVTVDANHPLAGRTLRFEVEVVVVRRASAEEILRGSAQQTKAPI